MGTKRNTKYQSEAAAAIHQTAAGLFEAGLINKQTMRDFEKDCLVRETRRALTDVRATDTQASDTPDADTLADNS